MDLETQFSDSEARRALLALCSIPGLGSTKIRALERYFESLPAVLEASLQRLKQVPGIGPDTASAIHAFDSFGPVDFQLRQAARLGATLISWWDDSYPGALRAIYDPPVCLWVRGDIEACDEQAVAIVGTRKPSHYGETQARILAKELASRGFTIIPP